MRLYDELYFEITAEGERQDVDRFVSFLKSGEFDDFFEFTSEYMIYSDNYRTAIPCENVSVTISNDDYGIELDSINPVDFLDLLCSGGKNLYVYGTLYDINNEEYRFVSHTGSTYFENYDKVIFLDELDDEALREESYEDDDDDDYE